MTDEQQTEHPDPNMATKVVYQTDADGYYLAEVELDASDISPDDDDLVWLIPGGCIEPPPPVAQAGQIAKWVNGAWALVTDLRGTAYWDPVSHAKHVIDAPEIEPPAGALLEDPGPSGAAKLLTLQRAARVALASSDISVLRCVERGLDVPAEWVSYRDSLRALVGAVDWTDALALPTRPEYPPGTGT